MIPLQWTEVISRNDDLAIVLARSKLLPMLTPAKLAQVEYIQRFTPDPQFPSL